LGLLWLDFSKEASSMGIPKSMAVAVSGLVFAGGAALAVAAAAPASAHAVTAAPQQVVSDGCCGGRTTSRWHRHQRNHVRDNSRAIVVNRNHNLSRSLDNQFQRNQQRQELENRRPFMQERPFVQERPVS
jgi:hypothetical protein